MKADDDLPPLPPRLGRTSVRARFDAADDYTTGSIGFEHYTDEQMRDYARAAVAEEREACAQLCDVEYYKFIGPQYGEVRYGIAACAAAIRARGGAR